MNTQEFIPKTNPDAHCWLHGNAYEKLHSERVDADCIQIGLPDTDQIPMDTYALKVDQRDKRALLIFDGDILCGGLSKSFTILHQQELGIMISANRLRDQRKEIVQTAFPDYDFSSDGKWASVCTHRNFILVNRGLQVFRRYRPDSLSPQYIGAKIRYAKNGGHAIEYFTSTY